MIINDEREDMGEIEDFIPREDVSKFFRKEKERITRYLMAKANVSSEQAEDAFSNGCMAMWQNIQSGKLTPQLLTCSLATYLTSCCENQLSNALIKDRRMVCDEDKVNDILSRTEPDDTSQKEQNLKLMEQIVKELPYPCEDLLWGKYKDGFSMTEMAQRMGYSNDRVAITTMHRCMDKLRKKFNSLRK